MSTVLTPAGGLATSGSYEERDEGQVPLKILNTKSREDSHLGLPGVWSGVSRKLRVTASFASIITTWNATGEICSFDECLRRYGDIRVNKRLREIFDEAADYMSKLLLKIERYLEGLQREAGKDSKLRAFVWSDPEDPDCSEICIKVTVEANSADDLEKVARELNAIDEDLQERYGKFLGEKKLGWILGSYFLTVRAL